MSKVLLVYPNQEGFPMISVGIGVLAGVLKHYGHKVELFDVTFMVSERLDQVARDKAGTVKKVDFEKYWGTGDKVDMEEEFRKKILSFKPDLIAFSIVENNYPCAKKLFKIAKEVTKVPIIAGGLFPTLAPEFFINDGNVDMICRGEGEYALLELSNRLEKGEDISNVKNLIMKVNGKTIENKFAPYYNWESMIFQDWEVFDERHLMKAFVGKMQKTGFFEMSRGCPFNCSYCANAAYQEIFKCLGPYHREKLIDYVMKEMEYMKNKYNLELVFFTDENFMMMGTGRFEEFIRNYKTRINLPFYIQTRADTLLDENKIRMLKEANCATIGIGIESGTEKIRKEILSKNIPDHIFVKAFANCNKYHIRTTANIIIGLPFETEKDILAGVELCKKFNAESIGVSIFAPYYGTNLRKVCIDNGYMEDKYYENISTNYHSILKMPQISEEKIEELYYNFSKLVYGDKQSD